MCNMPKVHQGCIECEDYPEACKGRERAEDCPKESNMDKLDLSREEAATLLFWLDVYCTPQSSWQCEKCAIEKYCPKDGTKNIDELIARLKAYIGVQSDLSDAEENTLP